MIKVKLLFQRYIFFEFLNDFQIIGSKVSSVSKYFWMSHTHSKHGSGFVSCWCFCCYFRQSLPFFPLISVFGYTNMDRWKADRCLRQNVNTFSNLTKILLCRKQCSSAIFILRLLTTEGIIDFAIRVRTLENCLNLLS